MKLGHAVSVLLAATVSIAFGQSTSLPPTKFAIALFPGFQAIDAFGPLDILNILAWRTHLNLTVLATTLDPISTSVNALPHNRSSSSFAEFIVPTHTYDTAPTDIEVLIVPGGFGNRLPAAIPTVEYIRRVYPSLKYLITVCTGSGLAARAGVLDHKRATTNKFAFYETSKLGPKTHWVAQARWVVDGNIWSSSGVSAGIDVTLAWVQSVWGYTTAKELADGAEYDWHQDADWDPFSIKHNVFDVVSGTTLTPTRSQTLLPSSSPTVISTSTTASATLMVTATVTITSLSIPAACITTTKIVKTTTSSTKSIKTSTTARIT